MQGDSKLALGVVTYNNAPEQLGRLAKSAALAAEGLGGGRDSVRLFVVDNGGESAWPGGGVPIERLATEGNVGFGSAMNRLLAAAFADPSVGWFLCLNPDGALHHRCLAELLSGARAHTDALIEARQFPEEHRKSYDPSTLETPWASGACVMIPRRVYETVGGFDTNFFMYLEDVDLSWRARSAGFRVRVAPRALFSHPVLDRGHNPAVEKFFLLSSRYMGHKWGEASWVRRAETDLVERGFYARRDELPPLPEGPFEHVNPRVADFRHGYFFARPRW